MYNIIRKSEAFVQKTMVGDPGHDWSHVNRVRKLAVHIGTKEKANLFIVELAALLHDVADYKFYKGNNKIGGHVAAQWLKKNNINAATIKQITYIIDNIAFKGAKVKYTMQSLEGKIVQDADKLDAMGAIGVARTFSFGGKFGVPMYVPEKNLRSTLPLLSIKN